MEASRPEFGGLTPPPFRFASTARILEIRRRVSSQFPSRMANWQIGCTSSSSMQPQLQIHPRFQASRTPGQYFEEDVSAGFHSISLEVSIKADIRRLVQALTVPEYVEAWITVPGELQGCSTVSTRTHDDYAIEHFCSGRPSVLISGRYRAFRRHKVAFSWRAEGDVCVAESDVEIRLRGDFERSTVIIRHSGFASRHDFAWHRALWTGSMARLAALYGPSDRASGDDGSLSVRIAKC